MISVQKLQKNLRENRQNLAKPRPKFIFFAILFATFSFLPSSLPANALENPDPSPTQESQETSLEAQETPQDEKSTLTDAQKSAIAENCATLKDNLTSVQHYDSRVRTTLGPLYDEILTNFITPLNRRLAANNLGDASLTDNQTAFSEARTSFQSNYIVYQKSLESLVAINCVDDPETFYGTLQKTREDRATVAADVKKLNSLLDSHQGLVRALRSSL